MKVAWRFLGALGLVVAALGCDRRPSTRPASPAASPIRFTDAAVEAGLVYRFSHGGVPPLNIVELMGAGAGFVDADADGWPDVVLVSQSGAVLYRNNRGRFEDVTAASGFPARKSRWYGCATGDYDNDGRVDLFLTGHNDTALLRNEGGCRFREVTDTAGVRLRKWASSAAFADVNRDGFLDLYVGCYVDFGPGVPEFTRINGVELSLGPDGYDAQKGVLFLNEGGKRFRDITTASGMLAVHGKALGVAFADPDQDGDEDLAIANDQQPLDFMLNDGKGRFRNVSLENGTAYTSEGDRQGGMGLDWADYDNDGRLDLFVANFADEPKSLYHNEGAGLYTHAGLRAGVALTTRPWVAFGAHFLDADHDGLVDLAITNGHVQDAVQKVDPDNPYPQKMQFFRGIGGGRFQDISASAGEPFTRGIVGRALAVGDYDRDGDPDVLVADLEGAPVLLRNDSKGGQWLRLRLENRHGAPAIGARVELESEGKKQVREVRSDGSYLAASEPVTHFGLAAAGEARVRVRWPSGRLQDLGTLRAGQEHRVRESVAP